MSSCARATARARDHKSRDALRGCRLGNAFHDVAGDARGRGKPRLGDDGPPLGVSSEGVGALAQRGTTRPGSGPETRDLMGCR